MANHKDTKDKKVLINFLLDADVKEQMTAACEDMGMTVSAALRCYCYRVARTGEIPFKLSNSDFEALEL